MSLFFLLPTNVGDVITLTNYSSIVGSTVSPTDSQAGVRINTDSTLDKYEDGVYTQINSATDWCLPVRTIGSGEYYVRCTDNNANIAAGSSATGTWLNIATALQWYVEVTGTGSKSLSVTLEISDKSDGSNILATGTFTGSAFVDV